MWLKENSKETIHIIHLEGIHHLPHESGSLKWIKFDIYVFVVILYFLDLSGDGICTIFPLSLFHLPLFLCMTGLYVIFVSQSIINFILVQNFMILCKVSKFLWWYFIFCTLTNNPFVENKLSWRKKSLNRGW